MGAQPRPQLLSWLKTFFTIFDLVNWNLWKKKLEYHLINYRFKYFRQIWSRFSGKVDLPAHFAVYSTLQNTLEWNWLTYFVYLQLIICRLIKHFTVIYADANKQFLTLNLIVFFLAAKKSPYLGPQSPYQKLQISLFELKKISRMVFTGSTGHYVGFAMFRLIWLFFL